MERVVIRKDYDPYMSIEKYLAVFPDDECNVGRYPFVSFYFNDNRPVFEPYGEMDWWYYYGKTKPVKAKSDEARECVAALEAYYNVPFRAMEKIRRQSWITQLNV